jgi:hypothetical protein
MVQPIEKAIYLLKIRFKEVKIEVAWEILPSMQDIFILEVTHTTHQNETTHEK